MSERRYVASFQQTDSPVYGLPPNGGETPSCLQTLRDSNIDGDVMNIFALVPLSELEAIERERAEMLALLHRVVFAEGDLTIEETKMVESFIARVKGTP